MTKPTFSSGRAEEFRANLLAWFDVYQRDLPWRRTCDPYAIWVSEIMLQQTRVAAVLEHYAIWMRRFPTIEALAAAPEEQVLAAWSGLGYYRRARFLHRGAKTVVADYAGQLPRTAAGLRELPGIGAYTSAAIASIAFGEAVAVVDGNVERVLLRQTGCCERGVGGSTAVRGALNGNAIQGLATQLIAHARPGDFNQAMMELGATVCLPKKPLCLQCPVAGSCRTRGEHPTAARQPGVVADANVALIQRKKNGKDEVFLEQRPSAASVMPGMWELPRLDGATLSQKPILNLRHAIMQTTFRVSVVEVRSASALPKAANRQWIALSDLSGLPLTGLGRKILLRLGLLARPEQNLQRE
jgi:A/G-specific adenine glycosylase